MRTLILAIFAAMLWAGSAAAQSPAGHLSLSDNQCSMFGEKLPDGVVLFASVPDAEDVIKRIVAESGLVPRFKVRAAGVPNAAAVIRDNERYVLYDPNFMTSVKNKTNSDWAAISIMAHEIGHHLNGHTLMVGGSRPDIELEADYFSGNVLQKMGATLDQARLAMESFGSDKSSDTHPAKADRLVNITLGWQAACGASCAMSAPAGSKPTRDRATRNRDGDSRTVASDGGASTPTLPRISPPQVQQVPQGFPSGTPTSACGCWGYVNPGASRQNPSCQSGVDVAVGCQFFCPTGGYQWQSVCR